MARWGHECTPEEPASNGFLGFARWIKEELSYQIGPAFGGRWDPPGTNCVPKLELYSSLPKGQSPDTPIVTEIKY